MCAQDEEWSSGSESSLSEEAEQSDHSSDDAMETENSTSMKLIR